MQGERSNQNEKERKGKRGKEKCDQIDLNAFPLFEWFNDNHDWKGDNQYESENVKKRVELLLKKWKKCFNRLQGLWLFVSKDKVD